MSGNRPVRSPFRDPLTALIVAVFVLATTIFVGYLVHSHLAENRLFEEDGVDTVATLTDLWRTTHRNNGDRPRVSYRYHGRVAFRVDGEMVFASARVSSRFYRTTETGAVLEVRYLASDPTRVRIDPRYLTRAVGFFWVLILFLASAFVWQFRGERRPRQPSSAGPPPRQPADPVPTPRWARTCSALLLVLLFLSFFTLSVWLRNAVEDATYERLGWLSVPLSLFVYLIPPVAFGLMNVALLRAVHRRGRR